MVFSADTTEDRLLARAGEYVPQSSGYGAFVPKPLPPDPALRLDGELLSLLSAADLAVGRLDGIAQNVPEPDLFVAMYVKQEAVLSSQIEGTQSTLEDLLALELDPDRQGLPLDVEEVVNYVAAMNYGLDRLTTLPLSLRLIREIHRQLLQGVRGEHRSRGEFRKMQNWIGPQGALLDQATFVPPPVPQMQRALHDFEQFLSRSSPYPLLITVGLAHAQFETIHPFLDGNGRVGRLLITLLLVHGGALQRPLLYLSHYFKLHRAEYYDRLMAIRLSGDWEGWLKFFLRGVATTATEAKVTAQKIFDLREQHRRLILEKRLAPNGLMLLALLFRQPLINVGLVAEELKSSYQTANLLVSRFGDLGLLREVTGAKRGRIFRYEPYLDLFADQPAIVSPSTLSATMA